jgi:hypothetical protein
MSRYLEIAREMVKKASESDVVAVRRDNERNEIRTSPSALPNAVESERSRWSGGARPRLPLRKCGSLICRACGTHSPSAHRVGCVAPPLEPCLSRWFWLSPHGAIKCCSCAAPTDLSIVEAWILARQTGDGVDGFGIPEEILSLLQSASPLQ